MQKFEPIFRTVANIFTIVGVLLTIYFSVFFVPGYIRDYENEKIKNVNKNLIETLQEIVYNNEELSIHDIKTFIKGKEIKNKIEYPYTIDELLIQTQDAFVDNTFIPLKNRKKIINQIDSLRYNLELNSIDTIETQNQESSTRMLKSKFLSSDWLSYIIMIVGVLISTLGVYSLVLRTRKERKEVINEEIADSKENIVDKIRFSLKYIELIENILQELNVNFERLTPDDSGADFFIRLENQKRLFIDVKYSQHHESFPSIYYKKFANGVKLKNGFGLFITNFKDNRAKTIFDNYKVVNKNLLLETIWGIDKEELKNSIIEKIAYFNERAK